MSIIIIDDNNNIIIVIISHNVEKNWPGLDRNETD